MSIWAAIATVFGKPPRDEADHYNLALYSAYLIWQTGMAFMIPFMLSHSALFGADQTVPQPRSPAKLSIWGKLFFFTVFATVLLFGYFAVKDHYLEQEEHRPQTRSLSAE